MLSLKKRKQLARKVKAAFQARQSTLSVTRYAITGSNRIETFCSKCSRVKAMPSRYWLTYDCYCTRAAHIGESHLATEKFHSLVKKRHPDLKLLGPFNGMNSKIRARCGCGTVWEPWAGALAKGHGCMACGTPKKEATMLKKYGASHSMNVPSIRQKRNTTMIRRYGTIHALQNKELYDKSVITSSKTKTYCLNGKRIKVQGYEPQGIDYLLAKQVPPNELECGVNNDKIPSIKYTFKGVTRVYHPDIFWQTKNWLFEVKSDHTMINAIAINLAKQAAAKKAGYKFSFLVMTKRGERLDTPNTNRTN